MARLSALIAAIAALAVAPVQAASFSSASLSDFRITLFDLNSTDGVTPGITFGPHTNSAFAAADDTGSVRSREASGTGPLDITVATTVSSAHAAVTGTDPANVTSLTASGSALGATAPGRFSDYAARAIAPEGSGFTVTANTRMSFSALANLEATTTTTKFDEFASASASLLALGAGPSLGSGFQSSDDRLSLSLFGSAGNASRTGILTVSFANMTGGELGGTLARDVFASGVSNVVPEPETYAMMVVGLGLLGFMLRRRGRQPRA